MRTVAASLLIMPAIAGSLMPDVASSMDAPSPAIAKAVLSAAGGVQGFPRLASLYAFSSGSQASAYSRYGLVVAPVAAGVDGAVQALKNQSPATKVAVYFDSSAVDVPGFDGMTIYPGWWLTLAGTTLAASLDATSTTVQVVNAGVIDNNLRNSPDVLVDGESMHVVSVNTSTNTLIVQRGYYSTASSHPAGARLSAHASNWTGSWMLNVTPYCPTDPTTGLTWARALAQRARSVVASGPWDGVFFDNVNTSWASFDNGRLDANNDNVADGGDGPSGTGWKDGETMLFSLTRSMAPSALLVGNGATYIGLSNGREMEHFPYFEGGWSGGFSTYLRLAGPSGPAPATILNADTNNTGMQNLQSMRFNLGTALMGNGYYAYDYGDQNHGQTWWYDEYDNGAGSSLAGAVDGSQTRLTLAAGTGSRFKVGDVARVPGGANVHDDEQMLVTGVTGDTLTVQRGYNGTQAAPHPTISKVITQIQLRAGQGWLGQPLGAAQSLTGRGASSSTIAEGTIGIGDVGSQQGDPSLWRRDFEHGTVLLNGTNRPQTVAVGPGYRRIAGTQDPATDNGAAVSTVIIAPQDALLLVRTS
jgi:hypothetical protein